MCEAVNSRYPHPTHLTSESRIQYSLGGITAARSIDPIYIKDLRDDGMSHWKPHPRPDRCSLPSYSRFTLALTAHCIRVRSPASSTAGTRGTISPTAGSEVRPRRDGCMPRYALDLYLGKRADNLGGHNVMCEHEDLPLSDERCLS